MSVPCPSIICTNVSDLAPCPPVYATSPISVLINCPAGYVCPVGLFPQVFTYQPGDIPQVQVCVVSSGSPIALALQGCSSMITRSLPAGSTQAVITAAVASMQVEWATQQGTCDSIALLRNPIHGFFVNDAQIYTCPNGHNPTAAVGINPQAMVFGGLGQSITLIVANDSENTITGSDFVMTFSNGGIVNGSVNIAPHTTMQEWNTVGGSPLLSWFITYKGSVIFSNPNNTNVVTCTIVFLNPFTGGGGVILSNSQIMVPAGTFAGATKSEANAAALKLLNETVAANLARGTLVCA